MSDESEIIVPPTEPIVTTTETDKPKKRRGRPPKPKQTVFAGADLVPNIDFSHPAVSKEYWYWIGVIPACPSHNITLGGLAFSKVNAVHVTDPGNPGRKKPQGVLGCLVPMNLERVMLVRERLTRTVIRFLEGKGQAAETDGEAGLEEAAIRPRKGQIITIPTPEYIAAIKAQGRPGRAYVPNEMDEPAARYMFAVLCENQKNPRRGNVYPDVLENTGLTWPEEIKTK